MAFLQYLPILFVVVLANAAARQSRLAPLLYAILLLGNVLLAGLGAVVVVLDMAGQSISQRTALAPGIDSRSLGYVLLATGVIATLVILPGVRRGLGHLVHIDPESVVHATALAMAVYYVGGTAATITIAGGLDQLAATSTPATPGSLLQSGAALVLIALFGVGFLIRRNAADTGRRLGLSLPRGRHLFAAAIITVAFLLLDLSVSIAWSRLNPGSYAAQVRVSQALFGSRTSVLLALSIALSAGIGEEILMRGALQPRFGLVVTAALFALGHQQYGFTPAMAEVFVVGLVLGVVRNRANTTTCILIHVLYNLADLLLAPLFP